jgi:hypothetical protein
VRQGAFQLRCRMAARDIATSQMKNAARAPR